MALTKRQKQVLDFIANFVDENGYCPSYEEIARGLELASLATVHKHISVLESKNYLKRGFNQSRSLELAPKYIQEQRRQRVQRHPDHHEIGAPDEDNGERQKCVAPGQVRCHQAPQVRSL